MADAKQDENIRAYEAMLVLAGHTTWEYLDQVKREGARRRAILEAEYGPPTPWDPPPDSWSEFDETENLPLSPPPSPPQSPKCFQPKNNRPIPKVDSQPVPNAEHTPEASPNSSSPSISPEVQRKGHVSAPPSIRITRSKSSTNSVFFELTPTGSASPLSSLSSTVHFREGTRALKTRKSHRRSKRPFNYRVQKV